MPLKPGKLRPKILHFFFFLIKKLFIKKLSNICAQFIVKCRLYFELVSFELTHFTDLSFIHFFSFKNPTGKKRKNTTQIQEITFLKGSFSFFFFMSRSAILLLWFFKVKQFYPSVKQYTTRRIAPDTLTHLVYQLYLAFPMRCLRSWEIYMKIMLTVTHLYQYRQVSKCTYTLWNCLWLLENKSQ